MSCAAIELDPIVDAVRRSFPLEDLALPIEFYPAHLSVALIDAIFRSRGNLNDGTLPAAERYCRWLGIARTWACRWEQPSPESQETLTVLIGRFDEIGVDRIIGEVVGANDLPPGAKAARVEFVLQAARELQRVGVEVLQDFQAMSCEEVEGTLGECAGFGEDAVRMLLMYAGNDDFVWADAHVRQFVSDALGRKSVSVAKAGRLVRDCAYELVLAPRYLDYQIWRHYSSWTMAA